MAIKTTRPTFESVVKVATEIKKAESFYDHKGIICSDPSVIFTNDEGMHIVCPIAILNKVGFTDLEISSWLKMDVNEFKYWMSDKFYVD